MVVLPGDDGRKLGLPGWFWPRKLGLPALLRSEENKAVDLASRALGAKAEVPDTQRAKRAAWNFIVEIDGDGNFFL
jgi:hypothetical protein